MAAGGCRRQGHPAGPRSSWVARECVRVRTQQGRPQSRPSPGGAGEGRLPAAKRDLLQKQWPREGGAGLARLASTGHPDRRTVVVALPFQGKATGKGNGDCAGGPGTPKGRQGPGSRAGDGEGGRGRVRSSPPRRKPQQGPSGRDSAPAGSQGPRPGCMDCPSPTGKPHAGCTPSWAGGQRLALHTSPGTPQPLFPGLTNFLRQEL